LLTFVTQVYNSDPIVRVEVVCLQPRENPEELMLQFKEIEVAKISKLVELARNNGKEEMAKQYERMAIWHKNAKKMHYPHFFKLILLRSLITHAFESAIGVSILLEMLYDKDAKNLLNIEIKKDILSDEKYKYLFSVEEVNKLVLTGIPFRDAYKKVGMEIEACKFSYDTNIQHTHEGSIGNLCTAEIKGQMQKVVDSFPFVSVHAAIEKLLQ